MKKRNLFEEYIRKHCRNHNQTIEKLAELSGISRGTFYNLLRENSDPKVSHLMQIAQAMKVHYGVLLKLKWQDLVSQINVTQCVKNEDLYTLLDEDFYSGTTIMAGDTFTQTWIIQNIGTEIWRNRYLKCIDEDYIFPLSLNLSYDDYHLIPKEKILALPILYPEERITLSVDFKVPKVPGRYCSSWKIVDEEGRFFYPSSKGLFVYVNVKSMNEYDRFFENS